MKRYNGKRVSYLANEKCHEDIITEGMIFKGNKKLNSFNKREENFMVNPGSDIKQIGNPLKSNTNIIYQRKPKTYYGYQHIESNLKYSFTAESIYGEEDEEEGVLVVGRSKSTKSQSTVMTLVVKKNKSPKGFLSSLTKKFTKHNSISKRSTIRGSKTQTKTNSKAKKITSINLKNINIPMPVIENMYIQSFTKHSYYVQRSLRRSTMIVNLITSFRSTYDELREIDTPKLKRRISFRKRVPKPINTIEQPKEGNLIELRMRRQAKYYEIFGNTKPFAAPKRRKRLMKKPLLEFSEYEALPSIPASAAGSKVNQYLSDHKETERKKLKPIKNINKELCLIFNKEYIPEEQDDEEEFEEEEEEYEEEVNVKGEDEEEEDDEDEEDDDNVALAKIQMEKGVSLDELHEMINHNNDARVLMMDQNGFMVPMYSEYNSMNYSTFPVSPVLNFTNLPMIRSPTDLPTEIYVDPGAEYDEEDEDEYDEEEEEYEEEDESESESESEEDYEENEEEKGVIEDDVEEDIESDDKLQEMTTVSSNPISKIIENELLHDKKERKRISGSTLYNEDMDDDELSSNNSFSDEGYLSDVTLKGEDCHSNNESSFMVFDEINSRDVSFHCDEEEEKEKKHDYEESDFTDFSFLLDIDKYDGEVENRIDNKNVHEDSFSLTKSFLLVDEKSGDSIIPKSMSNFLLNNAKISISSSEEDELFSNTITFLNNSIINESFSLTLKNFEDDNETEIQKEEKPLNKVDSGIDLINMNKINYLMESKC